jgi:hypothetical protein
MCRQPLLEIAVNDARSRLVNRCDPPGRAQTEYYPARVTKNLRKNPTIAKRPSTRRFFPRVSVAGAGAKTPRQIEPRAADVLPAKAAGSEKDGPRGQPICRAARFRQGKKNGGWKDREENSVDLIAPSPAGAAAPEALSEPAVAIAAARSCKGPGKQRTKDVIRGEAGFPHRSGHAPRSIFSLRGCARHPAISVNLPHPAQRTNSRRQDHRRSPALGLTLPPPCPQSPWAPACAGCLPHYSARLSRISASPGGGPAGRANAGGVAEWLKAHAWKVCMRETVSRVRIPLPPPNSPSDGIL